MNGNHKYGQMHKIFIFKIFFGERKGEKVKEGIREDLQFFGTLQNHSKFSRTRWYLPQHKYKEAHFSFSSCCRRCYFFSHGDPKLIIKIQRLQSSSIRSRKTVMAYTLPNLSTATLHQSSKDKAIIIHQTPLSSASSSSCSSSSSLLSLPVPTSSPKPSSCISPRVAQVNLTAPPAQDKRHNHRDDFFVNLGLAVRTLREDLPQLFIRDLNYDIYRDDIIFTDPLNTFTGIERYKLIFWALRFHGKILFREISLEVLRIWQPSENVILIRWNLKGVPRVPWETKGQFQGTSRYKLDRNGKIYEHKVDNLAFNFPQPLKPAATMLDLVAQCPTSPNPTFWWAPVDDYSSSWIEFYRAVKETLDRETLQLPQDCFVTCL